ncbi:phage baseplate assembly protein domain-containing protein [Rhizobium tumorigenes]|uniref:phage baseplate assembly protein domain-containing protein n=1 Tax=Rhizobium tumorigenes TaxID=2041385 RepID=UPI00241ED0E3|nr:phage baseplate assembly protein [Rhizobium tumorigenes]WFS01585.1 phage baseplate assembly protein [Rhizobium tumorigenes]
MSGERFEFNGRLLHREGQQFVDGRGFFNSGYTRIHRIETAGFASMPIKGAKGLLLAPNGDPDHAFIFGGEHPGHRPDLTDGGTAIYDHNGGIVKLIAAGIVIDVAARTATLTANGGWTINGPVTINGDVQVNGNITASGSVVDGDGNNGA